MMLYKLCYIIVFSKINKYKILLKLYFLMYMYILFRELFDFFVNNFCKINGEVNNMRDVYLWNRGSCIYKMCKYYYLI